MSLHHSIDRAFNCEDCGRPGVMVVKDAAGEEHRGNCCSACFVMRLEKLMVYAEIESGEYSASRSER